jgi:MFS family permease
MVDNLGRKKAMLISYGIATLGMILCAVSTNLYMVGVGLFLMGYGSDSAINICFYFIT